MTEKTWKEKTSHSLSPHRGLPVAAREQLLHCLLRSRTCWPCLSACKLHVRGESTLAGRCLTQSQAKYSASHPVSSEQHVSNVTRSEGHSAPLYGTQCSCLVTSRLGRRAGQESAWRRRDACTRSTPFARTWSARCSCDIQWSHLPWGPWSVLYSPFLFSKPCMLVTPYVTPYSSQLCLNTNTCVNKHVL